MGKVYTTEEVSAHHIPDEGSHELALDMVSDALMAGRLATASFIHGSVPEGRYNRRSDLDVLLLYEDPGSITSIHEFFHKVWQETFVKVESTAIKMSSAREGNHTIDALFFLYLRHAQQHSNFAHNDPVGVLEEGLEGVLEEDPLFIGTMNDYLASKQRRFIKALLDDDSMNSDVLQRALELPRSLGRKVLTMQIGTGFSSEDTDLAEGLRQFICDFLEPQSEVNKADGHIEALIEANSHYDNLLYRATDLRTQVAGNLFRYHEWTSGDNRWHLVSRALEVCDATETAVKGYLQVA